MNQQNINNLAKALRIACIRQLLSTDLLKHNATKTVDEAELAWRANEIYKLPIPTARLKNLFADCHQLRSDRGEFPHPVSVADLEYCVKQRAVGYRSSNICKYPWLPSKEDKELRALPEFRMLANVYKNAGKVIAPAKEMKDTEANLITSHLLKQLRKESGK